jgi:hypothetical protein
MLSAIREMAERKDEELRQTHLLTAEYLEACNLIFEKGILSHDIISSPSDSACMANISKGMEWFFKWKEELHENAGMIIIITNLNYSLCALIMYRYQVQKPSSKRFSCMAGIYKSSQV